MKTTLLLTGCVALATSMMILSPAPAQGGPGYGPPPGGPGGGPGHFGPSPDQLDANKDGKITNEEYTAAWGKDIAEQFKKLDTNSDGSLSKEELEKAPGHGPRNGEHGPGDAAGAPPPPPNGQTGNGHPPMRPPRPTAEQLDPNKDGKVTKDEYTQAWVKAVQDQFNTIDTDKNGSLSKEEMDKARGPERGQRGPGGPFGAEGGTAQQ